MFRLLLEISGLALASQCFGQDPMRPPQDDKLLHGNPVNVLFTRDGNHHGLVQVTFEGKTGEIKYAEVLVRAFDREGKALTATEKRPHGIYETVGAGEKSGFYTFDIPSENIAKVTVAWQGEEQAFFPVTGPTHLTIKAIHGGHVSLAALGVNWNQPGEIMVVFSGMPQAMVKYDDVSFSVFDDHGEVIQGVQKASKEDDYIAEAAFAGRHMMIPKNNNDSSTGFDDRTKMPGVFMGSYTLPGKKVSKAVLKWSGEEVEFSIDDMTAH